MELVLRGLHWSTCLVYLDDIIVYSSTIDEHFTRLREVFGRTSKGWTENQAIKMFPIQKKKTLNTLDISFQEAGIQTRLREN